MIAIIGAGISGLSMASLLEGDVRVFEDSDTVGGYCRTTKRNGFTWDRAGHFFHFKHSAISEFFDNNLSEDEFIKAEKDSKIFFNGSMVDFPFQKNIHQLEKSDYIRALCDLYEAQCERDVDHSDFYSMLKNKYGSYIAEEFLVPYNEKLYQIDLRQLDEKAAGRFFPETTFKEVLFNAIESDNESYNRFFRYPLGGAQTFVDVLSNYAKRNSRVYVNCGVRKVDIAGKRIQTKDGKWHKYSKLISTMPLPKLIGISELDEYRIEEFSYSKVLVFNIGFDTVTNTRAHWIYFPGNEIFYRVGCYHNIREEDRASIYVEIGFKDSESIDINESFNSVLQDLKATRIITDEMKVIDYESIIMDPAYVHMKPFIRNVVAELKEKLAQNDVFTLGRYGNWTYCSIEDNIVDAYWLSRRLSEDSPSELQFCPIFNLG